MPVSANREVCLQEPHLQERTAEQDLRVVCVSERTVSEVRR